MSDDDAPVCSNCGSEEVTERVVSYKTGVVAPDGGEEWWTALVRHCWSCGEDEEV
jgi:hypothetical protein